LFAFIQTLFYEPHRKRKAIINNDFPLSVHIANNSGIYKTTNSGTNWYLACNGVILGLPVVVATVAPSNSDVVYCQVDNVGVYKTTDCGSTWTLCPSFSSCGDMIAIAVRHDDPNTVMAIEGLG